MDLMFLMASHCSTWYHHQIQMPVKKGPNTVQITILVTPDTRALADKLARRMGKPGIAVTRTDILRAAVLLGLGVLTQETVAPANAKRSTR